jgi:HK97 family phage portal protein
LGLFSRIAQSFKRKSSAGSGYFLSDGWLPAGSAMNWWQMGGKLQPYSSASAMVEACIGAYSQTVAMCPGDHWRLQESGGRERVANSALARVLRKPNEYQSISDFLLNLTRGLYENGNAYALALRNDRNEIYELHLMNPRACCARVAEGGEIFYALGGNEIIDRRFGGLAAVPGRDVLHVRLHTPRDPLKGESPILAAALDIAAGNAVLQQQIAFFANQARPSFLLSTDQLLTLDQVRQLRAAWDEQTKGAGAGGTPILSAGLKPQMVSTTAQDAQLAETMKMSDQSVALAFRIPLQVLGLGGTTYASAELMMQSWVASGLGFALNHIEEAFGRLFRLRGQPDEYVEFSTKSLLRSAFKDRIEGLARGVQSGVYSPDEARAEEELAAVPGGYGAEPRVQQQVVPLSAWEKGQDATASPAAPASPPASPDAGNDNMDAEAAKALLKIYKGLA